MAQLWILLSTRWKLEDVQAVVTVIISTLSALGIFTYTRCLWQRGIPRIERGQAVKLSSLLTINTLGEAIDVVQVLGVRRLLTKEGILVAQIFIIVLLSATAVLSGPISRYSTRHGTRIKRIPISGALVREGDTSLDLASIAIDNTIQSLNGAGFPHNQMLDFLPDITLPWAYNSKEWNSTWVATWEYVPETPVSLTAVVDPDGTLNLLSEVPGVLDLIPPSLVNDDISWRWEAYYEQNQSPLFKDVMAFVIAPLWSNKTDVNENSNTPQDSWMRISILMLHFSQARRSTNASQTFTPGPIPRASYVRLDANLTFRDAGSLVGLYHAFPNTRQIASLVQAYDAEYWPNFQRGSILNKPITLPTGENIFRFFQAYTIVKDTIWETTVTRPISVHQATVELSTLFLTVGLLAIVMIVAGLIQHYSFISRHSMAARATPQSKIDWIAQSLAEAAAVEESLVEGSTIDRHSLPATRKWKALTSNEGRRERLSIATYSRDGVGCSTSQCIQSGIDEPNLETSPAPSLTKQPMSQTTYYQEPVTTPRVHEVNDPHSDLSLNTLPSRNRFQGYNLPKFQGFEEVVLGDGRHQYISREEDTDHETRENLGMLGTFTR